MKVFEFIEKLAMFHCYVMHENTGNAEEFAQKLDMSRSTLYNLLEELKSYNIDIRYSRTRSTYYYQSPDNVKINISIEQLDYDELENVVGGSTNCSLSMDLDKLVVNLLTRGNNFLEQN